MVTTLAEVIGVLDAEASSDFSTQISQVRCQSVGNAL